MTEPYDVEIEAEKVDAELELQLDRARVAHAQRQQLVHVSQNQTAAQQLAPQSYAALGNAPGAKAQNQLGTALQSMAMSPSFFTTTSPAPAHTYQAPAFATYNNGILCIKNLPDDSSPVGFTYFYCLDDEQALALAKSIIKNVGRKRALEMADI